MSDDVKLMLRLKDGDESAFETLVERHRTRVINTVYRFTGQRDIAEDLAQDVFISLYRAAPRYEPRAKFTTYLYRIVAKLVDTSADRDDMLLLIFDELADKEIERQIVIGGVVQRELAGENHPAIFDDDLAANRLDQVETMALQVLEASREQDIMPPEVGALELLGDLELVRGNTLAAITEYPDVFSAAIDQVGIANFVSFLENTADYRRHLREAEYGPLTDREFLACEFLVKFTKGFHCHGVIQFA